MTTTIIEQWAQRDGRALGREDACWYSWSGQGHDLVCWVVRSDDGRTINVVTNGEMDIQVFEYKQVADEFIKVGKITSNSSFSEYGIYKDSDLIDGFEDSNPAGYKLDFVHTPWFDLYSEDGDHLDRVTHTLSDAIEMAAKMLDVASL